MKHQGVGRDLQKQLMAGWYRELAEGEGPVAYLFISGNVVELLRAFGFRVVYPEVNALQCGVRKVAGDLILKAEDQGYSSDVCGYVKNDIGLVASGNVGPFGKLPKPDLLLCTYSGCATYLKWFEALAEIYRVPLVMLDVPYLRAEEPDPHAVRYVAGQLQELVAVCERISGKRLSRERLSEILDRSRRAEDLWMEILDSCSGTPSPFDAFFEAVFFMAPIYVLRGTEDCVRYYESALAEIRERLEHRIGPVEGERHRIVLEGPPPWPHFRAFWDLFKKWGVCCVSSTYCRVGGIWDRGFRHDPSRPFESIAEYAVRCYTNLSLESRRRFMREQQERFRAEALVIHSVKSCRVFSVGQADTRDYFSRERSVPTLFLESDLADPRYFSEAQMRNRIDAFFEAQEHLRKGVPCS